MGRCGLNRPADCQMENAKENPMEITITDTAAAKLRELLGLQDSGARIRLKPITVGCC